MAVVSRAPLPTSGTLDNRIIALMRLVLSASALLIIVIDPAEPSRHVALTYTTLALYTIYSVTLYGLALRCSPILESVYRWAHWADVGWYTLLISLSNGTSSIFFFGFFFAILVAAFRRGFAEGLRVTIASALLFGGVGLATAPQGAQFELNRSLVRPIYLLVLGYMMAYWGGFELTLKRRLALLKDIMTLSNPRFGIDRTLGSLLERLRAFYDADHAILITIDPQTGDHRIRRADRFDPERATTTEPLPAEVAAQLLALPPETAAVFHARLPFWSFRTPYYAYNAMSGTPLVDGRSTSRIIAAMLDAAAFVAIPFRDRHEVIGRLYLTDRKRSFEASDADFLLQAIEHVIPVIDNVRLVDRLATNAADEERQRIARDLHDSVIQPYIGLQIGLSAVRQKLANGNADLEHDIETLLKLTNDGIADLRGYVHGLKSSAERDSSLVPAIRRFGAKFAEATGINVQVEASADMRGNDRLAAEVFQMIAEGLSNIRRHTHATRASVCLQRHDRTLRLRIENDAPDGEPVRIFKPRSISERAAALGGRAEIEQEPGKHTAVLVEIPL
jgi:signal transduction histidine kinase